MGWKRKGQGSGEAWRPRVSIDLFVVKLDANAHRARLLVVHAVPHSSRRLDRCATVYLRQDRVRGRLVHWRALERRADQ